MSDNKIQVPKLRKSSNSIVSMLALLIHPQQTMRSLLETETEKSAWQLWVSFTLLLAVAALVIGYLQNFIWGEPSLSGKKWFLGIVVLIIVNLAMFYIESYFLWKASLWFGGYCEKSQMRIVFSWSTIISVLVFGSVDVLFTLLLGKENAFVWIVSNIGTVWGAVIVIASIRELTNLSIWKSGCVWGTSYLLVIGGILGGLAAFGLIAFSLTKNL